MSFLNTTELIADTQGGGWYRLLLIYIRNNREVKKRPVLKFCFPQYTAAAYWIKTVLFFLTSLGRTPVMPYISCSPNNR